MARFKDNLRVGKPQARPDTPAHVPGVPQGGKKGSMRREVGIRPEGPLAKGTARRSTGINDQKRNPIDPRSPNLSPS